ncbi:hypothetical protein AUI06_09010 [archaeon 13_2_20CM_2_52_21]|nr:MAG: hypothetical protein AUI06_09010 [archaeon 13_2_20CM_2_52_21]
MRTHVCDEELFHLCWATTGRQIRIFEKVTKLQGHAVVTENTEHFQRIPDLTILTKQELRDCNKLNGLASRGSWFFVLS